MRLVRKIVYYTLVVLVCTELAFWVLGYRPYQYQHFKMESNPKGAFIGDSLLGIKLNPGQYKITLNDSLTFIATHNSNNKRVIPFTHIDTVEIPTIHFFGCSFTYGYGVNDEETFASLTQKQFPQYRVLNHGVIGYGTVQSLLMLQKQVEIKQGDIVVLCFSSVHFDRNVLNQKYRLDLKIGFENSSHDLSSLMKNSAFPFVNSSNEIKYESWDSLYRHWFAREYLCTINYLQSMYDSEANKNNDGISETAFLMQEIINLTKTRGGTPLIFCLDNSDKINSMMNLLPEANWATADFDFSNKSLTNFPYDDHPNKAGHQFIFERLIQFINVYVK